AELILADEPVSAMDPVLAGHTLALLNREAAARGSTLLASLHAVDLALQHFPRVIGLRAGRIAFDLPAGEVDRAALDALYANEQLQAERASPAGEPAVVHIPRC
ncbi:TPA: phosphonate ABC transporter, partial [Pseudomonas aeruginosa]|nr:phosphonate ABC transporter [Pseudomonas aeruginosa]